MRANKIFTALGRHAFRFFGLVGFLLVVSSAALAQTQTLITDAVFEGGEITAADLNGDHTADLVLTSTPTRTHRNRHTVQVRLSGHQENQTFTVASKERDLTVAARDIDGDRDLDLVFTSRLTGEGVGIWLNNGKGVFTEGNPANRASWVWGQGFRLLSDSAPDSSATGLESGNDDIAVPDSFATSTSQHSTVTPLYRREITAARFRGAFYVRPPPQSL